ncbi:hypothetical protein CDL15_Pgr002921 [Punica granatum]|uniref:Bulb-type lectin domain-containing protein n=1 Tax=Punica granatum TaxID=22663 RepID=A0A218X271_PUNGR|nr:hypothetical protein CDL15_Pgr002921 [Punica granatum]
MKTITFQGGRMRFCPDLELHLVLIACLSSSSVGGEEQFDQSMATASLSTSWTLSNGSTCAEWFTDGSFLLPVLHMETYGFGFYGMETQISGDYFLPVFILPCYDYGLTSTPAAGCTPQLVWSPNWNSPVKMNSTLELESGGDLVLKDADRTVVWSTNTSGKSVAGMNLTGPGNLVLIDKNNICLGIVRSPDSLTACGTETGTRSETDSFSVSTTNLSEFRLLSFSLTVEGLFGLVLTDSPQLCYQYNVTGIDSRSSPPLHPYNNYCYLTTDITYLQYLNDSLVISMTTGSIECKFSVISIVTSRPVQYMKFSSHGHLRVYQWKREAFEWTETVDLMTEIVGDCGYPFVCGRYRICSNRQCRCPASSNQTAYFKQISDRNPGVGCSEILPLSCGAFRNVSFLELPGVAYFDFGWSFQNVTAISCKEACAKNCSCKAAFFYATVDDYMKCSLQYEVFSLMNRDIEETKNSSIAYVKVQSIPNQVFASSPKRKENRLLVV